MNRKLSILILLLGALITSCSVYSDPSQSSDLPSEKNSASYGLFDILAPQQAKYPYMGSEDGYGIMNCKGEWLIEPQENYIVWGNMVNNLVPAKIYDQSKYVYLNADGDLAFDKEFDYAIAFSEGYAAVRIDNLWGFIDTNGEFVIKPKYEGSENSFGSFQSGLVNVPDENGIIYIDPQGRQILGPYDSAASFYNGYAAIIDGEGEDRISGYIDPEGNFVLKFTAEDQIDAWRGYSEGLFAVLDTSEEMESQTCREGFMNPEGDWVIEPKYCVFSGFSEGLAFVSTTGYEYFYFIDQNEETIISNDYYATGQFYGGCAVVYWEEGMGLIDPEGEYIYQYIFEE